MTAARRLALIAGAMYLITFLTSIPALPLLAPVTEHADYVLGAGHDNQVLLGGFLEFLVALSGVGSALALYPVTKRVSVSMGLGFVTSRLVEAGMILVGVVSILSIVTLRQDVGGSADSSSGLVDVAHGLIAIRDWTFLFGPGFMAAINAAFLATILYRANLVPRIIPLLGLIGAPLLFGSKIFILFGGMEDVSAGALITVLPIAVWEFSLGCWLLVKGFRPSPVLAQEPSLV